MKYQKFKGKDRRHISGFLAKILAFLSEGPKTMADLLGKFGGSNSNMMTYLSKIRRAGHVVQTDRTVTPCVYRLIDEAQPVEKQKNYEFTVSPGIEICPDCRQDNCVRSRGTFNVRWPGGVDTEEVACGPMPQGFAQVIASTVVLRTRGEYLGLFTDPNTGRKVTATELETGGYLVVYPFNGGNISALIVESIDNLIPEP